MAGRREDAATDNSVDDIESRFNLENPSVPTKQPVFDSAGSVGRLDLYVDFCS
jgi:hypothetical protein